MIFCKGGIGKGQNKTLQKNLTFYDNEYHSRLN